MKGMDEMKKIDVSGKPCPIPVIETRKALAEQNNDGVQVIVSTIEAVRNLEKMAGSFGYIFSYVENSQDSYEVMIDKKGKDLPVLGTADSKPGILQNSTSSNGLAVVIGRNTMGEGAEELGKILIKGFIYSLTELPAPPKFLIFLNAGAYLTTDDANTVDDLKKLEKMGTEILTCGTCANYYGLQGKLAVGEITNMYGITERMVSAGSVINI